MSIPPLLNGRCTSLLRAPVSEMTYTVSIGTLNSIPYHTIAIYLSWELSYSHPLPAQLGQPACVLTEPVITKMPAF